MSLKNIAQSFFIAFVFIFVLGFIIFGSQFLLAQNTSSALADISSGATNNLLDRVVDFPQRNWEVDDLRINAKSGIALESNLSDAPKLLFSKNSDLRLPLASLTKLVTAMVVLDNYNLSDKIVVGRFADNQAPMVKDLKLGDRLTIEEYLDIMLIESSNKAAVTLAEKIGTKNFVALMNEKVKLIGLSNTYFEDPSGISEKNYSTSYDLSILAEYVLKNYPKIVDISRIQELDVLDFGKITNTNQLLGQIPEIIGGKTGFTTAARGCLLLVVKNIESNDYLIYVVLGSEDRFLEIKNIIDWTNLAYKWQ